MVLSLILSASKDTTVHIPAELFAGMVILLMTSFIAFLTWLTKQVINMARIIQSMQTEQMNQKADIELLIRGR